MKQALLLTATVLIWTQTSAIWESPSLRDQFDEIIEARVNCTNEESNAKCILQESGYWDRDADDVAWDKVILFWRKPLMKCVHSVPSLSERKYRNAFLDCLVEVQNNRMMQIKNQCADEYEISSNVKINAEVLENDHQIACAVKCVGDAAGVLNGHQEFVIAAYNNRAVDDFKVNVADIAASCAEENLQSDECLKGASRYNCLEQRVRQKYYEDVYREDEFFRTYQHRNVYDE